MAFFFSLIFPLKIYVCKYMYLLKASYDTSKGITSNENFTKFLSANVGSLIKYGDKISICINSPYSGRYTSQRAHNVDRFNIDSTLCARCVGIFFRLVLRRTQLFDLLIAILHTNPLVKKSSLKGKNSFQKGANCFL